MSARLVPLRYLIRATVVGLVGLVLVPRGAAAGRQTLSLDGSWQGEGSGSPSKPTPGLQTHRARAGRGQSCETAFRGCGPVRQSGADRQSHPPETVAGVSADSDGWDAATGTEFLLVSQELPRPRAPSRCGA